MIRYIDVDALIEGITNKFYDEASTAEAFDMVNKVCDYITDAPSIEAVSKDFHDKTCEAMAKRHTEEIQRLMPKRGEWIPCSERLPSGADAVLVSTCAFDAIHDVVFMMAEDVERFYKCGYVNAWMPSPEPWKGIDDES